MTSYSNHDSEEARARQRDAGHEHLSRHAMPVSEAGMPQFSRGLIGPSSLNNRNNAPVRAAVMRSMQGIHGNRAVQRFLQRGNTSIASPKPKEDDQLARRIEALSGSGGKLPMEALMRLEDGLGADLSGVRIHTGAEADSLARQMSAVAFTTGQDIFFREGTFDPHSSEGLRLLAHEASHTVQQATGPVEGTPMKGGVSVSARSDSFEQEAERSAEAVASGGGTLGNAPRRATALQTTRQGHGSRAAQPFMQRATAQQAVQVQRWSLNDITDPIMRAGSIISGSGQGDASPTPNQTPVGPDNSSLGPVISPDNRMLGPYKEPEVIQMPATPLTPGITIPTGDILEMAQAQQKKAEEREELRKTDPEKAALLDWQERPRRGGTIAGEMSASASATLSSGKSSVSSEILGKLSDAVDNPLETAVKATEYVQDPLKLSADAGKAVFGAGEATVGPDGTPRRGPSLFDRGLNEAEVGINDAAKSTADAITDIPIVGDVAKPYADITTNYVASQTQIAAGGLKALGGMAGGMSSMAADPEATAEMAWKEGENMNIPSLMNPFRIAHAGYEYVTSDSNLDLADVYRHHLDPAEAAKQKNKHDIGMVEGMLDPYKQSWEQGRYGEMAGRAVVDIGSLLLGGEGGAASKADMASDAARAAAAADEAGNMGRMAETGGVNPYGKTLPSTGTGPVNPYGQTMADAPAVNPYGKTLPSGPARRPQNVMEMDPLPPDYYPGMPEPPGWKAGPYGSHGPAPVDPMGKTLPGPTYEPFPNTAQTPLPEYPSKMPGPYGTDVMPVRPPEYPSKMPGPYGTDVMPIPEVNPYGQTIPSMQPSPTIPGIGPDMVPRYPIPGASPTAAPYQGIMQSVLDMFF